MKKYILFFLALAVASLRSQDVEPSQLLFHPNPNSTNTNIYLSADSAQFRQRCFMLGIHWGPRSRRHSEAQFLKQKEDWAIEAAKPSDQYADSCDAYIKPYGDTHAGGPEVLNGRGIHYDPTLPLNPNKPDSLVIRQGDNSGYVFGFAVRKGRVPSNPADPDFHRLILEDSLNDSVVLAEPWPSNQLSMHCRRTKPEEDYINENYLCQNLIIAINLRRYDSQDNGDDLLKVEIPYTVFIPPDSGLARFATVPSGIVDSIIVLNQRGIIRKTVTAPPLTTAFYIKRNMLPPNGQDITIMANITFRGKQLDDPRDNPWLKKSVFYPDSFEVDNIKIRITKMNSACSLTVKYVRLITPHTDSLMRGYYDEQFSTHVQNEIYRFAADSMASRGIRLFRFNTIVEGGLFNWITERYFNKLVGNISTCEVAPVYPLHYERYINAADHWFSTYRIWEYFSRPYTRFNVSGDTTDIKMYGVLHGYLGYPDTGADAHPRNSSYETYLAYKNTLLPITEFLYNTNDTLQKYRDVFRFGENHQISSLAAWELCMYYNYYAPHVRGALFSGINWWPQFFILNDWKTKEGTSYRLLKQMQPFTGEELNLACWSSLILGAKGIYYDGTESIGDHYSRLYDNTWLTDQQRTQLHAMSDWNFLQSDIAGPDFIRTSGEILSLSGLLFNFDTLAKYTARPKNKLYFGRKSLRIELRKLHELIRAEENLLMNLKLQCWYGKGYMKYYLQHPKYSYSLINNLIDTAGIRTRWPGSASCEGTAQYNYQDSSFFDMTILENPEEDTTLSNIFYIGLVNRRASPLVLENDTLNFYTTNEFDNFLRAGGTSLAWNPAGTARISRTAAEWKELYLKKRGSREITIPFIYRNPADTNEYCLLRITELGMGTTQDTSWWRREPFMKIVDTVLRHIWPQPQFNILNRTFENSF